VCALDPFCCDVAWDAACQQGAFNNPACDCDIPACNPDFVVVAPGTFTGNTSGAGDTCIFNAGEEHVYEVTLPNDGFWTFSTCNPGTAYDTWLDIGTTCCGTEIAVQDDAGALCPLNGLFTVIQINLTAGTYFVSVEGFAANTGAYELSITKGLPPQQDCCEPNPLPGCTEVNGVPDGGTCQNTVCACDSFCCNVAWDAFCVGPNGSVPGCDAQTLCGCGVPVAECCPPDTNPGVGCTHVNGVPDGGACQAIVCAADSFCCAVAWDSICADEAGAMCPCAPAAPGGGNGPVQICGACCDHSQVGGSCSFVVSTDCVGDQLEFFPDMGCDQVEAQGLCNEHTGACCEVGVACTDGVPESQCGAERQYAGGGAGPFGGPGTPDTVVVNINVPDSGTISDINVGLDVTHTWVGDMDITIEHNATSVLLVQQMGTALDPTFGCAADNLVNVVLDDEGAGGAIEDQCGTPAATSPPSYTPDNPLSAFDGMDKQGTWTLTIFDTFPGSDAGTLNNWSLEILNAEDIGQFTWTKDTPCADACPLCGNGVVDPGEDCESGVCCDLDTCQFTTEVCRPSEGVCDPAESCTGNSADCPADVHSNQVCRPAAGACDLPESCDGVADDCPPDAKAPAGTICSPSSGPCDPAEVCDGSNNACPPNVTINDCIDGDGCCPVDGHCNANEDDDCIPVCGNGRVEAGEQCDDGNLEPGDGCSELCVNEAPPVPTVTHWGMLAMILVLLAAIGAKFGRRRTATN
jgi:cysteine-rich repeat protein